MCSPDSVCIDTAYVIDRAIGPAPVVRCVDPCGSVYVRRHVHPILRECAEHRRDQAFAAR